MSLAWNRYGKSRVRLVKVRRGPDSHDLIDLTLDVALEGAFERVYVEGDNSGCLATDTMKNTVYALARKGSIDHVESFAQRLAAHFASKPGVSIDPGDIALTRMRRDFRSVVEVRANERTAALVAL